MKSNPKSSILKLNKNNFPIILKSLNSWDDVLGNRMRTILKSWYQSSFQKNNRWNKSRIVKGVKNYSIDELTYLKNFFCILFNCNKKYNKVLVSYLDEIVKKNIADESGLTTPKIKISQESFNELLGLLGEQKRVGEIRNNYQELAEIINEFLEPDVQLKPSTIIDRLKNKKGYK